MKAPIAILHLLVGQAETAAKVVADAYENNVYVGTIVLLAIATTGLFILLVRTLNQRSKDVVAHAEKIQAIHRRHEEAMAEKAKRVAVEFKEKDDRLYASLEKVTDVVANVSNDLRNLTEVIKERVRPGS